MSAAVAAGGALGAALVLGALLNLGAAGWRVLSHRRRAAPPFDGYEPSK
jgi:hypothetical protein